MTAPSPGPLDNAFREAMRLLRNCCYTPILGAREARRFCMATDTEQIIAAAQKAREGGGEIMGLDTSHDCWHGPYSMFMRWREKLNLYVMAERGKTDAGAAAISHMGWTREALVRAWEEGRYDDQTVPINVLMGHSDCEGEIPAEMCAPLADALEALLVRMPERALYDETRPATERFIAGLRRAAAAGEPVDFH